MNFTINQKIFCAVLARVQGITTPRATMPILANVLLSASAFRPVLHVSACDLEVGYTTVVDCVAVDRPGSVTVPSKKLYEIVKAAPTGEIIITLDPKNDRVTVSAGTFVTILAGLDSEDFPDFVLPSGSGFQLDAAALLQLIGHVDYAQAADETKYNLCGTFFRIEDGDFGPRLFAVTTDGHRLAVDSVLLPGDPRVIPADLVRGVIISRKGVAELKKIGREGVLVLQISGNNLSVSTDNETITLRLIDGEFPDYRKVIPTKFNGSITANRQPLIDALSRVAILAEGKMHPVTLEFAAGGVSLHSQSVDFGESCDRISAVIEWHDSNQEPYTCKANAAYLVQALSTWDSIMVEIHVTDPMSPLQFSPEGDSEANAVIMPLRN